MKSLRCSNASKLAYCAVPLDNFGLGYYMRPLSMRGLGMEMSTAEDADSSVSKDSIVKLLSYAAAIAMGIIIVSKLPKSTSEARTGIRRNPYGPKAEYVHLRVRHPDEFTPKTFRTIDPGRAGHIKAVIGRLQGQGVSTTQSVLVPIRDIPRKDLTAMKDLEARLESQPAGSTYELRKIVWGVSPKIGRQINKKPAKTRGKREGKRA